MIIKAFLNKRNFLGGLATLSVMLCASTMPSAYGRDGVLVGGGDEQANPEIEKASKRVELTKAQVDVARKQLEASKILLKAAEADFKASVADREALILKSRAKTMADEAGMTPGEAKPVPLAAGMEASMPVDNISSDPANKAVPPVKNSSPLPADFNAPTSEMHEENGMIQLR